MTEATSMLPLADVFAEMQKQMPVRLERPQLNLPEHIASVLHLNKKTAAAGQVSIDTNKPEPDSEATALAWARGDLGFFRFVTNSKGKIIGGVWSLEDTHVDAVNQVFQETEVNIVLSTDTNHHRETSSFIFPRTRNAEQADFDAVTLQLVEEFGLVRGNKSQLETLSLYMDGVERADLETMAGLGFIPAADGIPYEGSEEPCTVFIATPSSVKDALYVRAEHMGISTTPTSPRALR